MTDAMEALKELPNQLRGKADVIAVLDGAINNYERKNLHNDAILLASLRREIDRLWVNHLNCVEIK